MREHSRQSGGLLAPVPMPTLWPGLAWHACSAQPLKRLEQLRDPLRLPVSKLLLGDRVPKFGRLGLIALHVPEKDRGRRHAHSIITSAFSLVLSSSKKSF